MMVNQTSQAFSIYLQPSCIDLTVQLLILLQQALITH